MTNHHGSIFGLEQNFGMIQCIRHIHVKNFDGGEPTDQTNQTGRRTFFLFRMRFASLLSCALPGACDPHNRNAIRMYTTVMMTTGTTYWTNSSVTLYSNIVRSGNPTLWQNGFTSLPPSVPINRKQNIVNARIRSWRL